MTTPRALFASCAALAVSVIALASLARSASATTPCPNEQVRHESRINPATHDEPYDLALPECRAYEMVSPTEKSGGDVSTPTGLVPVAGHGQAAGFFSQNGFAGADNYSTGALGAAENPYIARRNAAGWGTVSASAPRSLIGTPGASGLLGDLSPNFTLKSSCGNPAITNLGAGTEVRCATSGLDGASWLASPLYPNTNGELYNSATGNAVAYLGSSANLGDELFQSEGGATAGGAFLPDDTSVSGGDGIYELENATEPGAAVLRLVNVETNGTEIGPQRAARIGGIGGEAGGPLPCEVLGGSRPSSASHAISESGDVIFFTACPSNAQGGANEIYARIDGSRTANISDPAEEGASECGTCAATPESAAFEGASADGSKAFFLTTQPLLPSDTDTTSDLYMYDFQRPLGRNLVQISAGGAGDTTDGTGAEVQGVVRVSSDGSHIYYVARGVLTTLPNGLNQVAVVGAENLYGYDTITGETKFVAELCSGPSESGAVSYTQCPGSLNSEVGTGGINDTELWGSDEARRAQATPEGRYLVFDTYAGFVDAGAEAETPANETQQVYRFDFQTGDVVRVSVGEPSYTGSNNNNASDAAATIPAPQNGAIGAFASASDWGRAISTNGTVILFATADPLQASDVDTGAHPSCSPTVAEATGCDVYEWHECLGVCADGMAGEVTMLSPGGDALSTDTDYGAAGLSESGADVFLFTRTSPVAQDNDHLVDLYDVRVAGGFPSPPGEVTSCSGEECQGIPSAAPEALRAGGSSSTTASGDLIAAPFLASATDEPGHGRSVKITAHSSKSLSVLTPSAGTLTLTGTGLVATKKSATKAGTYRLTLALTAAEQKVLARRASVTVTVRVEFVPTSGKQSTATARVTIRKGKPKSKSKEKR